jgi:RNA polymerase sigma-70 factor (ECF subfamily)
MFSHLCRLVYGFLTIGALPGKFVDATGVSLRMSETCRPFENARMSSWPPRRALTFPIVSNASQTQHGRLPDEPEHHFPSDEELMSRLKSNDASALEILFHRYARLVFRIARGVVRDSGEAEDVVQEAFFHLYKKSMLFDGSKGGAKNWIVQIALHRALDRKAHLARRGFYLGTNVASLGDTVLGRTDLDREIGSKMDRAQLQRAFQELPDMQRVTLELFYFEGLDLREISEKFNQSLGNTRHNFYRGLERLRKSTFVQNLRETKRC